MPNGDEPQRACTREDERLRAKPDTNATNGRDGKRVAPPQTPPTNKLKDPTRKRPSGARQRASRPESKEAPNTAKEWLVLPAGENKGSRPEAQVNDPAGVREPGRKAGDNR